MTKKQTIPCVYLLRHKGERLKPYVKIGFSKNLSKRLKSLETASPTGIDIIQVYYSKSARKIEQHLHRKYSSKQTNLEWFELSHEDLVDIMFYIEELLSKEAEYKNKKN